MHCSLTSNGSLQLILALHTHKTPRKRHSASRGGKSITTLIQQYPVYTLSMCDKLKLNFSSVGVDMCFPLGACRRLHSTETAQHRNCITLPYNLYSGSWVVCMQVSKKIHFWQRPLPTNTLCAYKIFHKKAKKNSNMFPFHSGLPVCEVM